MFFSYEAGVSLLLTVLKREKIEQTPVIARW
jgi:hypothetical protein